MATFPVLRSGAVAQYPLSRRTTFQTEILKFVDGSEQRYANQAVPVRSWTIQLDALDEGELAAVRQFFRLQEGPASNFTFTDPITGTVYTNCMFDQASATGDLKDVSRGAATMTIRVGV
jgi:hypothetical protein